MVTREKLFFITSHNCKEPREFEEKYNEKIFMVQGMPNYVTHHATLYYAGRGNNITTHAAFIVAQFEIDFNENNRPSRSIHLE